MGEHLRCAVRNWDNAIIFYYDRYDIYMLLTGTLSSLTMQGKTYPHAIDGC